MKPTLSLRQRALAALTRREHSRLELGRKLARHAESADQLEALLNALERDKLLSDARFSESLVHRRQERYGRLRIVQELEQHRLPAELVRQTVAGLGDTEFERCKAIWEKKFGNVPGDLAERARQTRFLAARGFDAEIIRHVLKGPTR